MIAADLKFELRSDIATMDQPTNQLTHYAAYNQNLIRNATINQYNQPFLSLLRIAMQTSFIFMINSEYTNCYIYSLNIHLNFTLIMVIMLD
jgi:hypothetical protein